MNPHTRVKGRSAVPIFLRCYLMSSCVVLQASLAAAQPQLRSDFQSSHGDQVSALSFDSGSTILASVGGSMKDPGAIKLWRLPDGRHLATLTGHTDAAVCVATSPRGKLIASGGFDCVIRLWNLTTKEDRGVLRGHTKRI